MSTVVAMALFGGVILYAVFGGADFGAGFWDLTAGDRADARALIDRSLGPVWEANHVWLILCLVVLWTAFPTAFADIMSTLFIPLGLAALGIVLRGAGFAFRKAGPSPLANAAFASSSVVTPFFLGTVAGGVASGRVPGGAFASWLNPTSLLGGVLAVITCAYLAAAFLIVEARHARQPDLERWFRMRAVGAAAAAGVVSVAGIAVLAVDASRLFHHLLGPALPLVVLSVVAGAAALPRAPRELAVVAVASIVTGWGVAQYPYLLGTHLRIATAAAPPATLRALVAILVAAVVLCVPSLAVLYTLEQGGRLRPDR